MINVFLLFLDYWKNGVLLPSSTSQKLQLLQVSCHFSIPHISCIRIPSLDLSCTEKAPLIRPDLQYTPCNTVPGHHTPEVSLSSPAFP